MDHSPQTHQSPHQFMQIPPSSRCQSFKFPFLVLTLTTISLAITPQQLSDTFNLHSPPDGVGGCDRNAPNGESMLPYVRTALTDAFNLAATVNNNIDSYNVNSPSSQRLRYLLTLFFSIKFNGNKLSTSWVGAYHYVKCA